ncbi:unnamed protein product, partial [Ixodes hexagonus]
VPACKNIPSEDADLLDVLAHKDTKKLGEEAIQVGQVLREYAKRLKAEPTPEEFPGDEAEEYFLKNLLGTIKSAVEIVEKVGGKIEDAAGDFIAEKAGELISGIIKNQFSGYSLEDADSYDGLQMALAMEIDQMGQTLIQKGTLLCK